MNEYSTGRTYVRRYHRTAKPHFYRQGNTWVCETIHVRATSVAGWREVYANYLKKCKKLGAPVYRGDTRVRSVFDWQRR